MNCDVKLLNILWKVRLSAAYYLGFLSVAVIPVLIIICLKFIIFECTNIYRVIDLFFKF